MVILLGGNSRQVWIDLCQKAHLDPHAVIENQIDNLLDITLSQEIGVIGKRYCLYMGLIS
jgi:hypothetical protein